MTSQKKFWLDRSAIVDPSVEVIVHKILTSCLQKPMTPLASRTSCCSQAANLRRNKSKKEFLEDIYQ